MLLNDPRSLLCPTNNRLWSSGSLTALAVSRWGLLVQRQKGKRNQILLFLFRWHTTSQLFSSSAKVFGLFFPRHQFAYILFTNSIICSFLHRENYRIDIKLIYIYISKEVYELIRPVGSQRPRMYGLPKIHKPGIPLQPILSMCHSAHYSLAKWSVEVLNPVLEFYSGFFVKDSFTFYAIICRLPVRMESQFLVSFDVVSLFTNIPLDKTISICAIFLYRGPSTVAFPFPGEVFIDLMGIATKSVSFSFNDRWR